MGYLIACAIVMAFNLSADTRYARKNQIEYVMIHCTLAIIAGMSATR